MADLAGARGRLVDHVDHVAIAVHDADKAMTFYTERLGLTLIGDEEAEEPGVRLAYLDGGNVMIQLVQPLREGPVARFMREHGEGLHHVCFNVPRIEEVLAALPGEADARIFMGGRGRRACFLLQEPNGVRVELTEKDPIR
ncbi:methylmalonyl-CoA epimerase [Thermocatellispora tengchongensis]|uniref:Methylmalonyl-CoA epimerase n=1 Tax=Thermocatellispora tengchongensis TaxID=1073253 RepID=A0A840P1W8_9ACTN|nr:VOC family protein [Thermocatellispora tengchongensis]MBB5135274.1 methylmalonyl-CoA epimerase [Thermocatellispora tengchongensis]